jgi:hypothetical protein
MDNAAGSSACWSVGKGVGTDLLAWVAEEEKKRRSNSLSQSSRIHSAVALRNHLKVKSVLVEMVIHVEMVIIPFDKKA